ncbi:hypothetical protein [Actinokineospora sp. HUAS TT18]|uniref:hypothetical protein n=1 Tax=Actinokineospora sp. HUAS TT18 TaxID=3447451 RepID=UPI003F525A78
MKRLLLAALVAVAAMAPTDAQAAPARPSPGPAVAVAAADARAYAWNSSPSAALNTWYSLAGNYSFNSTGGTNHAKRNGTGWYTVWFPGVSALGSTVQVTAYGTNDNYCTVEWWRTPNGVSGTDVDVRCFTRTGAPADSMFTISQTHRGTGAGAYVWANTVGTPSTAYQYNSTGGTNTVSTFGTGAYSVRLPGLGGSGGHVEVTGYAADGKWCKVGGWGPSGGAQNVTVYCFTAAGAPANAMFTLSYVENTNVILGAPATQSGYGWVSDLGGLHGFYAYDTNPGANTTVQRWATGGYKVKFPVDLSRGLVHVTAYGAGNQRCKVAWWNPTDGVTVDCYRPDGSYVDTYFDAAFVG